MLVEHSLEAAAQSVSAPGVDEKDNDLSNDFGKLDETDERSRTQRCGHQMHNSQARLEQWRSLWASTQLRQLVVKVGVTRHDKRRNQRS